MNFNRERGISNLRFLVLDAQISDTRYQMPDARYQISDA